MSKRETVEELLAEENPDALFADGFDEAIVGISRRFSHPPLVAYDYDKCIQILIDQGMTPEDAVDYFSYNVIGSWNGSGTPIFIEQVDE